MNKNHLRAIGVFALVAGFHLFIYANFPMVERDYGWPTIVMHNWHEYGCLALHGQLVANPGGLAVGEPQFIYPGHRPTFLLLPFLIKELPGAAGDDGLLYDFAVLALIYAAALWLLGTGVRGLLLASVLCLAPGVMRNILAVDTIGIPALLGLAAMGFAGGCLARSETKVSLQLTALGVMILFMLLNWSTLFSLGVAGIYIICRRQDWLKVAPFLAIAGLTGLFVLYISMHSRQAAGTNSNEFWNGYLWGPLGYDRHGMNFSKAFVRIMAVNLIAWLSLVVAGLVVLLVNGAAPGWRRSLLPLLFAFGAVFVLRNYNAHHPWNGVCIISLGLLFSLELLTRSDSPPVRDWRLMALSGAAVFAAGYLAVWQVLDEYNNRGSVTVETMVMHNTQRHALLVVAPDLIPAGVADYQPLAEQFDRKVVSLDEWNQHGAEAGTGRGEVYLLTHAVPPPPGARLVAQSHIHAAWANRFIMPVFQFYRTKISRRTSGDRKDYFDNYQLYRLDPEQI